MVSRAEREALRARDDVRIVTGVCPHDCPDTCAWEVAVDAGGSPLGLWGHSEHPLTRGGLCGKVDRYLERSFHPQRLTRPLRRVGAKGEGRFEPVSWEEALDEIADRLASIAKDVGPEAILPFSYSGTLGVLQGEGMASRLFNALGASQLARTICAEAGTWGLRYTNGTTAGMDPLDLEYAELVVLWGTNTLTSNLHLWPVILRAKKRGARVLVIDPVETRTARAADMWIPIRPGTDAALALGIMHVMHRDGRYDAGYLAAAAHGVEALMEQLPSWSPQRVAAVTGVPASTIEQIAAMYADASPAVIRINYGLQRHRGGGMAVRTIGCLPTLAGHWQRRGGGVFLSTSGTFGLDASGLTRDDLRPTPTPRTINMIRLGDALARDRAALARAHHRPRPVDLPPDDPGPPVRALVVYNANPAASNPDLASVRAGLARDDLFTVVMEHFQTDTADFADFVLPATTQVEHWDLHTSYGHLYLSLNAPAVAPVGEARSNAEIFRGLGVRLGARLGGALATEGLFDSTDEALVRAVVEAQRAPAYATISWPRLRAEGFVRLDVPSPYMPFARGSFPTPSGKCELYSVTMEADGYAPTPDFIAPGWLDTARDGDEDPGEALLVCVSPPSHLYLNSTFVNLDRLRSKTAKGEVWMHPDDAAARGLADGDPVAVSNARGHLRLSVRLRAGLAVGTVCIPGIEWPKLGGQGAGVNDLTSQQETDFGGGATFYDTLVHVTAKP